MRSREFRPPRSAVLAVRLLAGLFAGVAGLLAIAGVAEGAAGGWSRGIPLVATASLIGAFAWWTWIAGRSIDRASVRVTEDGLAMAVPAYRAANPGTMIHLDLGWEDFEALADASIPNPSEPARELNRVHLFTRRGDVMLLARHWEDWPELLAVLLDHVPAMVPEDRLAAVTREHERTRKRRRSYGRMGWATLAVSMLLVVGIVAQGIQTTWQAIFPASVTLAMSLVLIRFGRGLN